MIKISKILVLFFLLMAVGVATVSARGNLRLGLEFGNPLGVVIIRPEPFDFRIGYSFAQTDRNIFLSGDYRIINSYQLVDFLHIFLGVGIYTHLYFEDRGGDQGRLDLGARIPVGLQAFLLDSVIEIFAEIAPTINFVPTIQAFRDFHGYVGFTIRVPI